MRKLRLKGQKVTTDCYYYLQQQGIHNMNSSPFWNRKEYKNKYINNKME